MSNGKRDNWVDLILTAVAGAVCLSPIPWLSVPAAAVLTLWLPGRFLTRALGWDDGCAGRGWIAVAASVVLIPLPLSWVWNFSNSRGAVLAALVGVNLALLLLAAARRRSPTNAVEQVVFSSSRSRRAFVALLLFIGGCVFGTLWFPQACGRAIVQPMGDYAKHHAVLLSLEQHPVPLHNIFYAAEKDTPYYYYQYHHQIAAALRKLTADRVSIPFAFALSSALAAVAFVAITFLLAREFLGPAGERGAWLAATCVSLIGGWDAIPTLIRIAFGARSVIILDSWASCPWRIHNLMTQFMWCPQHVAAALAVLLAARWLRRAPSSASWLGMAPALAASIFGSSVHLAMTAFSAAATYLLLRAAGVRRDRRASGRLLLGILVMAVLGGALMGPQAWGYAQMAKRIPGGLTMQWPRFEHALLGRLAPPGVLANWLDAPWMLLVDFGLPLVACLVAARAFWGSVWRDDGLRLLLLIGAFGVLAVFTVRSNHSPFDYGFRTAVMPAQVLAAICAGSVLTPESLRQWARRRFRAVLIYGCCLGLPVGLYEAPMMAARTLLKSPPEAIEAGAIRYLRDRTPLDAVVQADPVGREGLSQLINRQIGVTDPENSHVRVFYPLDMQAMRRAFAQVNEAFMAGSSRQAYDLLYNVGVDYVLVGAVERKLYGSLTQFEDDSLFECVYRDEHARVYRLREQPAEVGRR
jgi:hypothetical protein